MSGVSLPGTAVVPPMHSQPLSLMPNFHQISPGDHGHTSWWTVGPNNLWQPGSFHHINNTVRPSELRPAGTELTTPLSQQWPIAQHPTIPRAWGIVDCSPTPKRDLANGRGRAAFPARPSSGGTHPGCGNGGPLTGTSATAKHFRQ